MRHRGRIEKRRRLLCSGLLHQRLVSRITFRIGRKVGLNLQLVPELAKATRLRSSICSAERVLLVLAIRNWNHKSGLALTGPQRTTLFSTTPRLRWNGLFG